MGAASPVPLEGASEEARAVAGHQERRFLERSVQALGFSPRRIGGPVARGEVTSEKVSREVVDHRHRVPPAVTEDVDVSDVGLPQFIRRL